MSGESFPAPFGSTSVTVQASRPTASPSTSSFGSSTPRPADWNFQTNTRKVFPANPIAASTGEETIHHGVTCDFCGKVNIRGVRYKCLQCFSKCLPYIFTQNTRSIIYTNLGHDRTGCDRCSACMSSPKAWQLHTPTHQFFPIQTKDDIDNYNQVYAMKGLSGRTIFGVIPADTLQKHGGVHCNGCNKKDTEGTRYKCLVCADYDLCEACMGDPQKRQHHDLEHPLFPIQVQGLFGSVHYDSARKQLHERRTFRSATEISSVRHLGVVCDMCKQIPLLRVRHRCLDCPDYDLCTQCISDPTKRIQHDLMHVFFPVNSPMDDTMLKTAVAARRYNTLA